MMRPDYRPGTEYLCPPYTPMCKIVTPAERPGARIDVFTIDEEDARFYNLGSAMSFRPDRVMAGTYARLVVGKRLMMSDTPEERASNLPLLRKATGDVLVLGLGLGMLPVAIAAKPDVTSLTIVEVSEDVIHLTRPVIDRLPIETRIIHADALLPERADLTRAKDGGGFDAVIADIWPTISADDYPEHIALRRVYRPFGRAPRSFVAWQEDTVKREWRKDRAESLDPWHSIHRFDAVPETPARDLATRLLAEKRAAAKEAQP